jgi:lysozyme family protein
MKYLLSLVIVMGFYTSISMEPKVNHDYISPEYQRFLNAYKHVRSWEGNYSNLEYDAGGETYAGITRNFNKDWAGWDILDEEKKTLKIEWNTYVPELEEHVVEYYYTKWIKGLYHRIKDPIIASYLFDYANTGIVAIKHTQQILIQYGHPVTVNYRMDMRTINAINRMNPSVFLMELKEARINFYNRVSQKKPELEIYLKGWTNRAESIIS